MLQYAMYYVWYMVYVMLSTHADCDARARTIPKTPHPIEATLHTYTNICMFLARFQLSDQRVQHRVRLHVSNSKPDVSK